MPQVIGTAPLSFKGKDGSLVEGMTIYTSSPLDPAKGATVRKVSDPLEVVDIEI